MLFPNGIWSDHAPFEVHSWKIVIVFLVNFILIFHHHLIHLATAHDFIWIIKRILIIKLKSISSIKRDIKNVFIIGYDFDVFVKIENIFRSRIFNAFQINYVTSIFYWNILALDINNTLVVYTSLFCLGRILKYFILFNCRSFVLVPILHIPRDISCIQLFISHHFDFIFFSPSY